jgi:hypothetical protein
VDLFKRFLGALIVIAALAITWESITANPEFYAECARLARVPVALAYLPLLAFAFFCASPGAMLLTGRQMKLAWAFPAATPIYFSLVGPALARLEPEPYRVTFALFITGISVAVGSFIYVADRHQANKGTHPESG